MKSNSIYRPHQCKLAIGLVVWTVIVSLTLSSSVLGFQFGKGNLQGSLDTTLSYGLRWRVQKQDSALVGLKNGGQAFSVNGDDGNLNFGRGLVNNAAKITSDLDMSYRNFGVFLRGSAFYDYEYEEGDRDHIELSEHVLDLVGKDARVLDAYLSIDFDLFDKPVEFRIGEQVVSWGEGTFFQNSINTINPIDVSALRLPGGELREALLPDGMVYASIGITENTNFEGLYLYDWDKTDIDPSGSYFSTNDYVGHGGSRVMLGTGDWSEFGTYLGPLLGFDPGFMGVSRGPDVRASDDGQFGLAFRLFAPFLSDTEFGFYYTQYHSRLPVISVRTGTTGGAGNAVAAATSAQTFALDPNHDVAAAIAAGTAAGTFAGASDPAGSASSGVSAAITGGVPLATAYATDLYTKTAAYYTEYPEYIRLFGFSFNTDIGATGIALQGEISHRIDVPLQIDDTELLFAGMTPLSVLNPATLVNQLGSFGTNEIISGFIEKDITQVQTTATKVFGPTLGADTFILLGEVAWTHVHNMPGKDILRLEAPGTYTSGNPFHSDPNMGLHPGKEAESSDYFADRDSWGYRLAGRFEYSNALGPVSLIPRFAWQHDVCGNSPGPGGNFLEDRKAITIGLTAAYLNSWSADLSYTSFLGAGRHNLVQDRDFVAANIKYSF